MSTDTSTPTNISSTPPNEDRCIINELPPEILSHIFLLGLELEDSEDEADEKEEEMKVKKRLEAFEKAEAAQKETGVVIPKDDGDSEYEDVSSDEDSDSDSDSDWQLLVTQVCRRWREVALEIPQLWSSVEFTTESPLAKANAYLERAKGAPLELSIDFTDDDNSKVWNSVGVLTPQIVEYMERFVKILQIVQPHLYHTRALQVEVALWKYMGTTLMFLGQISAAPMLEVLQLYHYEDLEPDDEDFPTSHIPEEDRKQDFVLFHGNAPMLKEVALWGVHLDWDRSTFLEGLHDLELAFHDQDLRPSFKTFARILHSSPKLEVLTISQSGPKGDAVDWLRSMMNTAEGSTEVDSSVSTEIQLPSVKDFVLAHVECGYGMELVERLAMPKLISLTLDLEEDDHTVFVAALCRPHRITRQPVFANITTLQLNGLGLCMKGTIEEAMAVLQKVTHLRVNFHHVSRDWYEVMFPSEPSSSSTHRINLPRLETFHSIGLIGDELTKLVKARTAAGVPLLHLYVSDEDDVTPEEEHWLEKESGLKTFKFFENSDDEDVEDGDLIEVDMEEEDFEDWYDDDEDLDDDDLEDYGSDTQDSVD
ncbi:hypothetical protein EIP91_002572 [Steccherinum ochraceum]|uniref:Uncharacterized protein n=1 Tax=Steccherinum ochraceum TaxID=92696 RepID=A0A4R0RNP9_9APHY|nr:hypothetical protein EIP91_002572 [Steccherinum ochraceum]